jgi:hypothetical protein
MRPEEKQKMIEQALEKDMVKLLKGHQENNNTHQKDFTNIRKKNSMEDVITLYFRVAGEEKKENVLKRLEIFEYFLDSDYYEEKVYLNAWINAIKVKTYFNLVPSIHGSRYTFLWSSLGFVLEIDKVKEGSRTAKILHQV